MLNQRIRVHESIVEIGRAAWEEISADRDWEWSYDYLSFAEASRPERPRYVASYTPAGRLLGAFHARLTGEGTAARSALQSLHASRWLLRSEDPAALREERALVREVVGDDPGPDRWRRCGRGSARRATRAWRCPACARQLRSWRRRSTPPSALACSRRWWTTSSRRSAGTGARSRSPPSRATTPSCARCSSHGVSSERGSRRGVDRRPARAHRPRRLLGGFTRNRRVTLRGEARSIARSALRAADRAARARRPGGRADGPHPTQARRVRERCGDRPANALLATHLGDRLRVLGCFERGSSSRRRWASPGGTRTRASTGGPTTPT